MSLISKLLIRSSDNGCTLGYMNCCKVGTVARERGLTVSADMSIDEYLVARWSGTGDYPAVGVRKLADWFNKQLLRDVYTDAGRNVTDIRIESEYEVLSSEDDLRRAEVIDDLEADGIDGEDLIDDFVSRSTMRRHLKNCLGARKDEASDDAPTDTNWEVEQVQYGTEKLRNSVREAVTSLDNKGLIPGGTESEIEIPVLLTCPECSTQVRLETALNRGYVCKTHLGPKSRPVTSD